MTAIKKIWENVSGLWSLVVGLKITGKNFMDKQVTLHYPRETVSASQLEGFRGPLELVGKPKALASPKCISCMMCVSACPSGCISITKAKAPKPTEAELQAMDEAKERGEKVVKPKAPKEPVKFMYDFSLCSLCGSCVENCAVGAIRFSDNVYFASTDRNAFNMDLLFRLEKKGQRQEQSNAESAPQEPENSTKEG
ncbi:4Fe-4S dicluster domain-containing protein [Maridesulfovibrio frigidus]|uniref:4Fe-4S dicluster domain-containing protein n=1 Tax=Maridesulfovibrio frigidus TaxID=340956 RepID=UPI0004E0EF84|nr:4Fe-4S dicluster domain-containing protein [Maridesulfovibrio frigidus]